MIFGKNYPPTIVNINQFSSSFNDILLFFQMLTMSQWREYRETYTSLTHLVKKIDDHINVIVALSIGSNIYFICAQLITEIE